MNRPKRPRGWNSSMPARSKGLPRGGGPKRTKRVKPRNVDRLHRKRGGAPGDPERETYGDRFVWVSGLPCCVCGKVDGAPAEHWKTVGSGGTDADCIPVCADHSEKDQVGRATWRKRHEVDVEAVLAELDRKWEERQAA